MQYFFTVEIAKYLITFLHHSRTSYRTVAKRRTWGMNTGVTAEKVLFKYFKYFTSHAIRRHSFGNLTR